MNFVELQKNEVQDGFGILYGACGIKLYTIKFNSLVEVKEEYAKTKIGMRVLPREFIDDKVNGTGLYFCSDGIEVKEDSKGIPEEVMYKKIADK
jgi:hypothetical protein